MGNNNNNNMTTVASAPSTPTSPCRNHAATHWPILPPTELMATTPAASAPALTNTPAAPPLINLANLNEQELVQQVQEACQRWGFFQVVGHEVALPMRERFEHMMRGFFALSPEDKVACERSASNARGYVAREMTKQKLDHKECFDVGNPVDWSQPDDHPVNQGLNGVNRFPEDDVLPGFRGSVQEYFLAMEMLSQRVGELMALGMGVDRGFFSDLLTSRHTSHLRLNHYPELLEDADSDALGVGPHTDAGFLTVLAQDPKVHTLQVKDRETGGWVTVTPHPGAFTINTGDLCVIFSNGLYHAPEHRVLTSTTERYSAPYFYSPGYDTEISPIPSLVSEQRPAEFWAMNWGYFRAMRAMGNFGDFGAYVKVDNWRVREDGGVPEDVSRQEQFAAISDFNAPFDINVYQQKMEEMK